MAHNHCNGFRRSELLRRAAAEAGRGLPAVQAGTPLPAGTGLSRRSFLMRSGGLALTVYGASKLGVGAFEEGVAKAAAADGRVLVSVFLEGGIDSLSVLAPVGDGKYRGYRKTLALPEGSGARFAEDDRLMWHTSAAPLAQLHAEGKVSVLPAVGYTDPDQSHFTSRHYWEVGALQPNANTGWMGRYLDVTGSQDNPLQGLSLDGRLSPSIASANVPVAAIDGPTYDLWGPGVWGDVENLMFDAIGRLGNAGLGTGDPAMARSGAVAAQAMRLREQLLPFEGADSLGTPVPYPDVEDEDFPTALSALAAMLAAGLPLRCVSVNAPGDYDTHDSQPEDLADNLKLTADTLLAFQRDLETRGLADRVLTLVWSEFGRRVEQNASDGTDHGAAGCGFVIGSGARGRMIGEFPGLDQLDPDGNLRATSDFRALYCSLIEQWFAVDAGAVIPDAGAVGRVAVTK
jgi:uncharacterized protein (DUF1501 family)